MIDGSVRPTGQQYEIRAGQYTAVVTELGAGLRSLRLNDRELVMEFPEDGVPVGGSGQLLIPWPNRIRDGRYTFEGVERELEITEPARDNAIHGLTRREPWTVESRTDSAVTLALSLEPHPGYPFPLELTARYELDESSGLTISVTARNAGEWDAPYGIGSHAYLKVDGGLDGPQGELRVPAGEWLMVDERMIPQCEVPVAGTPYDFREIRALHNVTLDTAYTEIRRDADGNARVTLGRGTEGATMWFGAGLEWVQLFSGDPLEDPYRRSALAVEPMSCPPNAFNDGKGVIVLAPGQSVSHTWGIVAGGA
ncbi:aldose 1-epimerase family protein [Catenulispora yoronensis]|uniref:Aldose 1-epimerase family protein n=1 Tax=Catenulispora yoronensis TaxID=450799 RepID=A0ABN2V924_9ACTN